MASIDDCYNQLVAANGELSQIDQGIQTVNTSLQTVDADVQATTAAVQTGFGQLYTIANYTNQLLLYQIQQNDTMVCYLEKISRQTCALLNEAALQTAAQQAMREDLDELRQLYELANPAAAVEQHRLEALKAQVEKCCPPAVPTPPCKFEPCKQPGDVPPPPRSPGPVAQPEPRPQQAAKATAAKKS
jgi:paraquat-inducible protein B